MLNWKMFIWERFDYVINRFCHSAFHPKQLQQIHRKTNQIHNKAKQLHSKPCKYIAGINHNQANTLQNQANTCQNQAKTLQNHGVQTCSSTNIVKTIVCFNMFERKHCKTVACLHVRAKTL